MSQENLSSGVNLFETHGTESTPGIKFTSDADTGIYRAAENTIGFTTGGDLSFAISDTAVTALLPIVAAAGLVGTPSVTFTDDLDTGLYSSGSNSIDFATQGVRALSVNRNAISTYKPVIIRDGDASTPQLVLASSESTGLYSAGADTLGISTAGVNRISVNSTGITTTVGLLLPTTGGTASSLNAYETGTFDLAGSGAWTVTWTVRYVIIGKLTVLTFPSDAAAKTTANSRQFATLTSRFRPSAAIGGVLEGYDNGGANALGFNIGSDGALTMGINSDHTAKFSATVGSAAGPLGWTVSFVVA